MTVTPYCLERGSSPWQGRSNKQSMANSLSWEDSRKSEETKLARVHRICYGLGENKQRKNSEVYEVALLPPFHVRKLLKAGKSTPEKMLRAHTGLENCLFSPARLENLMFHRALSGACRTKIMSPRLITTLVLPLPTPPPTQQIFKWRQKKYKTVSR